jgi:hypothetical protein
LRRRLLLYIGSAFLLASFNATAIDCSAVCPTRPIGVLNTGVESVLVSPPKIPQNFSGCQTAWGAGAKIRLRLQFESGTMVKFEAFNTGVEPNSLLCNWQDGKLTPASSPQCTGMSPAQFASGFEASEIIEAAMNWPDGECLPKPKPRQ